MTANPVEQTKFFTLSLIYKWDFKFGLTVDNKTSLCFKTLLAREGAS